MNTLTIWIIILITLIIFLIIYWVLFSYSYNDLLENIFYLNSSDYLNLGYDDFGNVFLDDLNYIRQKPTKVFYTEDKSIKITLDKPKEINMRFNIIFTDKNGNFIDSLNKEPKNKEIRKSQININEYTVEPYSYFFLIFSIVNITNTKREKLLNIQPQTFNLIKKYLKLSLV